MNDRVSETPISRSECSMLAASIRGFPRYIPRSWSNKLRREQARHATASLFPSRGRSSRCKRRAGCRTEWVILPTVGGIGCASLALLPSQMAGCRITGFGKVGVRPHERKRSFEHTALVVIEFVRHTFLGGAYAGWEASRACCGDGSKSRYRAWKRYSMEDSRRTEALSRTDDEPARCDGA